jgi:hypothetical protein
VSLQAPERPRSQAAKIASLTRWSYNREAGLEQLAAARKARDAVFINESERKLYFARLSQAGVKARRAKARRKSGAQK